MAAKVATGTQGSNEREERPGLSYARALNPKSDVDENREISFESNNKENIDGQVSMSSQQQTAATSVKERFTQSFASSVKGKSYQKTSKDQTDPSDRCMEKRHCNDNVSGLPVNVENSISVCHPETSDTSHQEDNLQNNVAQLKNSDVGSDSEFQTVAPKSARRKEKLREHREHRERYRFRESRHQPRGGRGGGSGGGGGSGSSGAGSSSSNGNGSNERSHKDRANHPTKEIQRDDQNADREDQSVPPLPVKYVEAPLPTVNPWTKGRTTVPSQQIAVVTSSVSTDRQNGRDKRVLQPQQQQGTAGKFLVPLLNC